MDTCTASTHLAAVDSSFDGGPNPEDPLANDVAQHWLRDEKGATEEARQWTLKHAINPLSK